MLSSSLLSPRDSKRWIGWQRMAAVLRVTFCFLGMICAAWVFIDRTAQMENPGNLEEKINAHAHMSAPSLARDVNKLALKPLQSGSLGGAQLPRPGYITHVIGTPISDEFCNYCDLEFSPDGTLGIDEKMCIIGGLKWHPVEQTLYYTAMNLVRKIDPATGRIITLAGRAGCNGHGLYKGICSMDFFWKCLSPGDGGDALNAVFFLTRGIEFNLDTGGLYIVEAGHNAIRYIDPETNIITSVVGQAGKNPSGGYAGDGGPATEALLNYPHECARDHRTGDLYISDCQNGVLRRVDGTTGIISSFWKVKGLLPVQTQLIPRTQGGLDIYMASVEGYVYKIDSITGNSSILAGNGKNSSQAGDGGPAIDAYLYGPAGVQYDTTTGDLYISDYKGLMIRKVDGKTGIITTIAGKNNYHIPDNSSAWFGDDGPVENARFAANGDIWWVPEKRLLFVNDLLAGSARVMQL